MGSFWDIAGGGITSGIFDLAGGLIAQRQASKNIDKQIAAQKEENALTRQYNLDLAKMQNQWNIDQWNRENQANLDFWNMTNEYNSPSEMVKRLEAAGMNKDLAYGNIGAGVAGSLSSGDSPYLTSGASGTSVDMSALGQKPTIGQAVQHAVNQGVQGAQLSKLKSDIDKSNSETARNLADINLTKQKIEEGKMHIKLMNSEITLNATAADLNKQEQEKLKVLMTNLEKQTEVFDSQLSVNRAHISQMKAETFEAHTRAWLNSKEFKHYEEKLAAHLRSLGCSADLAAAQAKETLTMLPYKIAGSVASTYNTNASTNLLNSQNISVSLENGLRQYTVEVDKEFYKTQKYIETAGQCVNIVTDAVNSFSWGRFGGSLLKAFTKQKPVIKPQSGTPPAPFN